MSNRKTTIELCKLVAQRTGFARTSRDVFKMKDKNGASLVEMFAAATDCMHDYEALIEALSDLINRLSGKDTEGGAE